MYAPRRHSLSVLSLLTFAAGCSGPEPHDAWAPTVVSVPAPVGEGSAEPYLSTHGDRIFLSWLQASAEGGHDFLMSEMVEGSWAEPTLVAHSDRFFVNWADFPSLVPDDSGRLWAHWLQRGEGRGYDYGIRVVRSDDGGRTWSEPWTPHDDGTPTEHGFVNMLPLEGGVAITWLDGRKYAAAADGSPATNEMTVRYRTVGGAELPGPEQLLDGRACDCCQTDAALTDDGPVVVYRDRTEDEIRDIYITRWTEDGWTEGVPVHSDRWNIPGCPVNGPAVGAHGRSVAVAWFTAADDSPKVKVAFSPDGGATFGPPVRLDGGNPAGRVDLAPLDDGSVVVSWLERTGGEGAEVRARHVSADGTAGEPVTVATSSSGRASGFPRMVSLSDGDLLVAWTDVASEKSRIMLARLELPSP